MTQIIELSSQGRGNHVLKKVEEAINVLGKKNRWWHENDPNQTSRVENYKSKMKNILNGIKCRSDTEG